MHLTKPRHLITRKPDVWIASLTLCRFCMKYHCIHICGFYGLFTFPMGSRWKSFGRALSQLDRFRFQSFDPHCSLVRSRARYFSTLQFEPQVLDSWQMLVILWSLLQSGLVRRHAFQDWNGDHYIIATPLLWATSFIPFYYPRTLNAVSFWSSLKKNNACQSEPLHCHFKALIVQERVKDWINSCQARSGTSMCVNLTYP